MLVMLFLTGELLFCGTADVYEFGRQDYEDATVTARIVSDWSMDESRYHYIADSVTVNGREIDGKLIVSYSEGNLPFGAVVRFCADVKSRKFSTHWNSINNFRKGEHYSANTDEIEILYVGSAPLYDTVRYKIKSNLYTTLRSDTADIITPFLLGETRVINKNLREDMSAAGLAHLFAVSGLHISFLAAAIESLLKRLKTGYVFNILITNAVLLLYAGLCCWSSSVLRAIIMFDVYALSRILGVKGDPLSSLSLAGIIILLLFPEDLLRVGYHMSMLAVAGLCLYTMGRKRKKRNPFAETLVTSAAVNVPMLPVMVTAFGTLSLFGMLSNMLILPIASFMYVFVFVNNLFVLVFPFLKPTLVLSSVAVFPIKLLITVVGQLNFGVISAPSVGWGMIPYFVAIAVSSRFLNVKSKIKTPITAAAFVASVLWAII